MPHVRGYLSRPFGCVRLCRVGGTTGARFRSQGMGAYMARLLMIVQGEPLDAVIRQVQFREGAVLQARQGESSAHVTIEIATANLDRLSDDFLIAGCNVTYVPLFAQSVA